MRKLQPWGRKYRDSKQGPPSQGQDAGACVRNGHALRTPRKPASHHSGGRQHHSRMGRSGPTGALWGSDSNRARVACPEQEPFSLLLNLQTIKTSRGSSDKECGHTGGSPSPTSASEISEQMGEMWRQQGLRSGAMTTLGDIHWDFWMGERNLGGENKS